MYNGDTKEFGFNNESNESVNEIVEIGREEEIESLEDEILYNNFEEPVLEDKTKKKKKNIFKVLKDKWNKLSKKGKIIIISVSILVLIAIIVLLVVLLKKDTKEPQEEPVVLEADNYRYENGKLFFLDSEGEDIGSYDCQNKDEKLCYVAYSSNEDNFDVAKDIYEDETDVLKRMSIINDNYVFIFDNKNIDDENIILHSINENADYESYKLVKGYDLEENYVIVKNEHDNYGVLKFSEDTYEEVVEFQYDYLGIITENKEDNKYIVGVKNDKWYLIDYTEKEVTKAMESEIKNYNDSLLAVATDNEYSLYDYKGNDKGEETYDYITFVGDYVFLVKDKELFITDSNLNKLYEGGIKLSGKDYNRLNVFNKESGKLIESRYVFGAVINNTTIELTLEKGEEDEVKLINTLESVVSSNYEYISYFDGKLYFYSDPEKTKILGSYECTNKNDITSESSVLDNCYIANNSEFSNNDMSYAKNNIGLLPIFNNRFVFIKDTPELTSEDTMNIALYDLAASKKLGTYRSIDALTYNGKTGVSFAETTGALVIAKNTKNYYGILQINLSAIETLDTIKFNDKYKNIEEIKDNFILEKATGTYLMVDKKGENPTAEFNGKIMGYKDKFVKVKSGEDYKVYTTDGAEVSTGKYKYVELYNTVYAAIDSSNKLNLYKYSDTNNKALCSTSIDLDITTNYKEGKSFNVTEANGVYTVTVYKVNGGVTTHTCAEAVNSTELDATDSSVTE